MISEKRRYINKKTKNYSNYITKTYPTNEKGQLVYKKKGITIVGHNVAALEQEIGKFRRMRMHNYTHTVRRYNGIRYTKVNGFIIPFEIPMLVKKRQEEKYASKLTVLGRNKKPATKDTQNNVGIEIEFISVLSPSDLMLELVKADVQRWCTRKDDGSLRVGTDSYNCAACNGRDCECDRDSDGCSCECTCSDDSGATNAHRYSHELVMIGTESNYKERLKKILAVLNGAGKAIVNRSCGLHVHLDMRHRDASESYKRLLAAQPLLYSMVSRKRYENSYCAPTYDTPPFTNAVNSSSRYFGVNATAYRKHKTIEIRLHSGTTNYEKINNFIELLKGIVSNEIPKELPLTVAAFVSAYGVTEEIGQYAISRIQEFSGTRMSMHYANAIAAGTWSKEVEKENKVVLPENAGDWNVMPVENVSDDQIHAMQMAMNRVASMPLRNVVIDSALTGTGVMQVAYDEAMNGIMLASNPQAIEVNSEDLPFSF